jgi:DNA-binding transcriptional MerR regulator
MHLTIGEVLSLLKEEFPDVSISKIRFLESQGLVDPERTPSGYRKFYDHDVDRLRWILRQQREHFLPLKVIRGRLTGEDGDGDADATAASPDVDAEVPSPDDAGAGLARADVAAATTADAEGQGRGRVADTALPVEPAAVAVEVEPDEPDRDVRLSPDDEPRAEVPTPTPTVLPEPEPEVVTAPEPDPEPVPRANVAARSGPNSRSQLQAEVDARRPGAAQTAHPDVYTAAELAGTVGCAVALINELVQYGILSTGANVGGVAYFDPPSLALARIGARFSELGVEPRHLRTWRNAAEREAGLFEQLVMPLLRQRNPQARQQAVERLDELTLLGADLRAGLISEAVRQIR